MNTMNHKHDPGHSDISKKKDIPCGVVQDLLILYEDNVCSDDSSSLIQEHIKDCDNCRNAYEQAAKPFPAITADKEEEMEEGTRFIKALRKCRKKITLLNAIIAGFFLLVAAALIRIGWMEFKDSSLFAVSADDVRITELYQLAGGDIYCTLEFPKQIIPPYLPSLELNDRSSDKKEGHYELHCQYPLSIDKETYFYLDSISIIFPAEVSGDFYSYPQTDHDASYACTSIYYQGKNKNDRLVIWEKGQTLEPAPKEIEEKAIFSYQLNGNASKALNEIEAAGGKLSQDEMLQHFIDYYKTQKSPDCFPIQVHEERE